MRITVRGDNLDLTDDVRAHAERRVRFALGRFAPVVDRVKVRLGDVNGPRGGVDKHCRIVVELRRAGQIVVDDANLSVEAVIDRAADRIGRAVGRRLERDRELGMDRGSTAWRGA